MEAVLGALFGGIIGLLIVALVGLVIGAVAKLLMPGKDPGGWFATILFGIAGSIVGRAIGGILGVTSSAVGLVLAVLGAMLLLFVYRRMKKPTTV